jgi:hypothetical protein
MDGTQDRYPDINAVLPLVFEEEDFPVGPIERFEVTLLASGEATARVWPARAEEPVGFYYGMSQLGG